jgi:hypothetical protein
MRVEQLTKDPWNNINEIYERSLPIDIIYWYSVISTGTKRSKIMKLQAHCANFRFN